MPEVPAAVNRLRHVPCVIGTSDRALDPGQAIHVFRENPTAATSPIASSLSRKAAARVIFATSPEMRTTISAGVPEAVIVDLIHIYSYDVDFQREVKSGDKFDILYTSYVDERGQAIKGGAIQYAELMLQGKAKPLYRFTTSDDKATDYFTPKGISGKRQLMRTPIDGARLTSGYGMRFHPILGYTKMHKGVDFGAPTGTPVMASGNGVVKMAGWHGGYGRYIELKHVSAYSTAYAHLSRFARGIKSGARVRQGQVIGFVGTTGRSTGPHLHYEVLLKDKQINPMGVKLPTGRELTGKDLLAFQENVARVQTVLATLPAGPAMVAQVRTLQ